MIVRERTQTNLALPRTVVTSSPANERPAIDGKDTAFEFYKLAARCSSRAARRAVP